MEQVIDYKVYGLNETKWKIIATLYNEELIRPFIDSLEDYSRVMVISHDYINNEDNFYLVEDIENKFKLERKKENE